MRVRVRGKCHWGDLVKLHQRERPSSDRTTNDVCTYLHEMWRHERTSPPRWGRRLSGPLIHLHRCKASGIPPSTHRRRRFQLIRQRAFHTRRVKMAHEFAVWPSASGLAPLLLLGLRLFCFCFCFCFFFCFWACAPSASSSASASASAPRTVITLSIGDIRYKI